MRGRRRGGRGPLAGPVFAAAVILDPARPHSRPARFEAAVRRSSASAWRSRSARTRSRGRWRPPTWPKSTRSTSCRRRCWRCAGPSRRFRCAARGAGRRQPVPAACLPGARDRQGRPRRRVDLGGVDPGQDRTRRTADRTRRPAIRCTGSRTTKVTARRNTWPRSNGTDRARSIASRSRRSRRCASNSHGSRGARARRPDRRPHLCKNVGIRTT